MNPKINFCLENPEMPRTFYWEQFLNVLREKHQVSSDSPDYLIPMEDTAIETNWPQYGNISANYTRGTTHDLSEGSCVRKYYEKITRFAAENPEQKILVLNKHPFYHVSFYLRNSPNIYVADGSLVTFQRSANPRTVSFPSLPISTGSGLPLKSRKILASFQGVNSSPIRKALEVIGNNKDIVVNLVEPQNHVGKINATENLKDSSYECLLQNSIFAFVPRGDANFSYRLLEVMSFGCIPVILSDGWILPFDRTVPWNDFSFQIHGEAIAYIPYILRALSEEEIIQRHLKVRKIYESHFKNFETIIHALFHELQLIDGSL